MYFTNCTAYTMTERGILDSAVIGFHHGEIIDVNTQPDSVDTVGTYINLNGAVVTPGFIDLHTFGGQLPDNRSDAYATKMADHISFTSRQITSPLSHGITSLAVRPPADSLFGGLSALVLVYPDSEGNVIVLEDSLDYQISLLGAGWQTRHLQPQDTNAEMRDLYRLREAIRQLENPAYQNIDFSPLDEREMFVKVIAENIPIYLLIDNPLHYQFVPDLLQQQDIRYYYGYCSHLVKFLDTQKPRSIKNFPGIVLGPSTFGNMEDSGRFYSIPSVLTEFGLHYALTTYAPVSPQWSLRHKARRVQQYGVSETEALAAITSTPGKYVSSDSVNIGTIQPGAMANLLIFTESPLAITSELTATWVKGIQVWSAE